MPSKNAERTCKSDGVKMQKSVLGFFVHRCFCSPIHVRPQMCLLNREKFRYPVGKVSFQSANHFHYNSLFSMRNARLSWLRFEYFEEKPQDFRRFVDVGRRNVVIGEIKNTRYVRFAVFQHNKLCQQCESVCFYS